MISKELLSEVFGYEATEVYGVYENVLRYETSNMEIHMKFSPYKCEINIYELAHKCKEWALEKNMWVMSHSHAMGGTSKVFRGHLSGRIDEEFYAENENQSIFKACQWILDNKDVTNGN